MTKYIDGLNRIVWGAPALVLIVGVGLYLKLRLRFAQLTLFPRAWRRFLSMLRPGLKSGNGVTPFQALCTALAATVGTGNIVGVAGAICLGGRGPFSGCGFAAFSGWSRNTRKSRWRFATG